MFLSRGTHTDTAHTEAAEESVSIQHIPRQPCFTTKLLFSIGMPTLPTVVTVVLQQNCMCAVVQHIMSTCLQASCCCHPYQLQGFEICLSLPVSRNAVGRSLLSNNQDLSQGPGNGASIAIWQFRWPWQAALIS